MTWSGHLDHLDDVTTRARRAVDGGDALGAAAVIAELDHQPGELPPLPRHLADRAARSAQELAALDASLRRAMARLEPELALLERVRPADSPPQYLDTSA